MSKSNDASVPVKVRVPETKKPRKRTPKRTTLNDKIEFLKKIGRDDLVEIFREWEPRTYPHKKKSAPLDQRITVTVTEQERFSLNAELKNIEGMSASQFIRNRAMGSVDINEWRTIAEKALAEIEYVSAHEEELEKQVLALVAEADMETDNAEAGYLRDQANETKDRLKKISSQNMKRNVRLSGRMSMHESETVKWRAQRLMISTSDYLRMMIFGLLPDSIADQHMNMDAKKRFYVSIIDVAENGWGTSPAIYECSQCANYVETIEEMRKEMDTLRREAVMLRAG